MDISIVVPCLNGERVIAKQLDALLAQDTSATYEIVVADNGSTDGTVALVQSYADQRIRLADAGRAKGANVARNVGISASGGDYILLADCDDIVHDGWIEAYWQAFRRGTHAAGGSIDRVLANGTLLKRESQLYPALHRRKAFANSANCGFSRDLFDRVGGFDESFVGGAEEVDFFWRATDAGYALELVPDAMINKVQRTALKDAFNQYFQFGRGEARLAKKFYPLWRHLITVLAAAQTAMWAIIWCSGTARRQSTTSLAFNLGMFAEGVRATL